MRIVAEDRETFRVPNDKGSLLSDMAHDKKSVRCAIVSVIGDARGWKRIDSITCPGYELRSEDCDYFGTRGEFRRFVVYGVGSNLRVARCDNHCRSHRT